MNVDEELEEQLRHRLHAQEPVVATAPDLASRMIATGSAQLRRRRRRVVGWTALATVAVVAGSSLLTTRLGNMDGTPAPGTPGETQQKNKQTERFSPGVWANQLPRGAAPDVTFLAGTTLHLANGTTVDLDGATRAELIGQTVAGAVVLVEDKLSEGEAFSSRYVLVDEEGSVFDMPVSTRAGGDIQDELVSPDGRYFTSGGPVIDKSTGDIVGETPPDASVLWHWTPSGIIYLDRGGEYYLWQIGGTPLRLDGFPGSYPNGTDVGLRRHRGGCTDVVHIDPTGGVAGIGQECLPTMVAISPDGTLGLTAALEVIDTATGTATTLTDQPVSEIYEFTEVHWESDDTVLIPIPDTRTDTGLLVRCQLPNLTCERASDPIPVGPAETLDLP